MIISIKPWLEVAGGTEEGCSRNGGGLVELTSDAEMEQLLKEAGRLEGYDT